jgi:hypothetical protein
MGTSLAVLASSAGATPSSITRPGNQSGVTSTAQSDYFTDQLSETGGDGSAITCIQSSGTGALTISDTGRVSTTGTLPAKLYTATGTVQDADGDSGTWDCTLTIEGSTLIHISSNTGSVTTSDSGVYSTQLSEVVNKTPGKCPGFCCLEEVAA